MKIILATNNKHKIKEISEILSEHECISLKDAGITHETVEDGTSFEENAIKKAKEIAEISNMPALADDSGLCCEALNSAPGINSARYASNTDANATDADNRALLIKNMQSCTNRTAYFCSCVALYYPDGKCITAEGRLYGEIALQEVGDGGFGYDCLFYLPDRGVTVAQLSEEEKNAISHRGIALRALKKKL